MPEDGFPEGYPEYAKQSSFTAPAAGGEAVIFVTRSNKGVRGWVMHYLGDDPESDVSFYEPGYCTRYPRHHDFEADPGGNIPDVANDVSDHGWTEPTGTIYEMMQTTHTVLIHDERIARTIRHYRDGGR